MGGKTLIIVNYRDVFIARIKTGTQASWLLPEERKCLPSGGSQSAWSLVLQSMGSWPFQACDPGQHSVSMHEVGMRGEPPPRVVGRPQ